MNTVERAIEEFRGGNYAAAAPLLEEASTLGNGWAALYLGWLTFKGIECEKSAAKAEELYRLALARGVPEATYFLASLFHSQERMTEALRLYRQAANDSGTPAASAAYWAYLILRDGIGVPRDRTLSIEMLDRAVKLGHIYARRDYAKRLLTGKYGIQRIPLGICHAISVISSTVRIRSANPDDYRLR